MSDLINNSTSNQDFVNYYKNLFKKQDSGLAKSLANSAPSNMGTTSFLPDINKTFTDTENTIASMNNAVGSSVTPSSNGMFGFSNNQISSFADIGNLGLSALATYDMFKTNKLNRDAIKFNIATARSEQDRRNKNIAGFNSVTG